MPKRPDILIADHGTMLIMTGASAAGSDWLEENLAEDVVRQGSGFIVEPRHIEPLVEGARRNGLRVADEI